MKIIHVLRNLIPPSAIHRAAAPRPSSLSSEIHRSAFRRNRKNPSLLSPLVLAPRPSSVISGTGARSFQYPKEWAYQQFFCHTEVLWLKAYRFHSRIHGRPGSVSQIQLVEIPATQSSLRRGPGHRRSHLYFDPGTGIYCRRYPRPNISLVYRWILREMRESSMSRKCLTSMATLQISTLQSQFILSTTPGALY